MVSLAFVPDSAFPIYRGQRNFARARLNLPARVITFNGSSACTLIDMSRTGAKIGAADCPRVGSMVIIEGLPMELFGTVCWSRNNLFGFEFDQQISHENVIAMRRHADGEVERQKQDQLAHARNWVQGVF